MQTTSTPPHVTTPLTDPYSSIGRMITSKLPSAPEYSIGKAPKDNDKKMYVSEAMAKLDMTGVSYKAAPNSYFQAEQIFNKTGKMKLIFSHTNPSDFKYSKTPIHVIGTQRREAKPVRFTFYDNPDELNVVHAQRMRKRNSVQPIIGTEQRFHSVGKNKDTPSPLDYRPAIGNQFDNPPKYTLGVRRAQSQSKLRKSGSASKTLRVFAKNNDPGPASYFTEKKQSASQLKSRSRSVRILRQPQSSAITSTPVHHFQKSLRSDFAKPANTIEQTYDIKNNTMMANYDFQADGGKGMHSGLGWLREKISDHVKNPAQKNRMKSYSVGKRERGEGSRGIFKAHMEFKPTPVRIIHPKF